MTPRECDERALTCAANAVLAVEGPVAQEFSKLAAQWRAMAAGALLFRPDEPASPPS